MRSGPVVYSVICVVFILLLLWLCRLWREANAAPTTPMSIFHADHSFVLPHASLRLPLPEFDAICQTGSSRRWQPQTPAMAAGLTDRGWALRGVLMFGEDPILYPHGGST